MIFLFTDFGWNGPYAGQMAAVLRAAAPGVPVQPLMHDAPTFDPVAAGHVLAAVAGSTLRALDAVGAAPQTAVFLAVVDPGVGTARRALAVRLGPVDHGPGPGPEVGAPCLPGGATWFVGPDNGLLVPTVAAALMAGGEVAVHEVTWRPAALSPSFHGRDLFAPVAARLARGVAPELLGRPLAWGEMVGGAPLPGARDAVVYIDGYGNAWTGRPANSVDPTATLRVAGRRVGPASTFGAVPVGAAFWYANSSGLVEIAVNQGRADRILGLAPGTPVAFSAGS